MKISVEYNAKDSFILPDIIQANLVGDYNVLLTFSDGVKRKVDFAAFLKKYPHPRHNKYNKPENFKRFKVESGNIVWGENWDLIFPLEQLYDGKIKI
jgi:hypothetical protein